MKKLFALILALVLPLSLVACGSEPSAPAEAKNAAIVEYVNDNKAELLSAMESSFATSSGMTCTSSIKVSGMGFVISLNINELDNIDSATKATLQSTYDSMGANFDTLLDQMQTELPELEYYEIRVCEKDGDLLATVVAGNK